MASTDRMMTKERRPTCRCIVGMKARTACNVVTTLFAAVIVLYSDEVLILPYGVNQARGKVTLVPTKNATNHNASQNNELRMEPAKKDETSPIGYPNLEYLPLLPWELESMDAERLCNPPPGVPRYCCIGSKSSGGEVNFHPLPCKKSKDVYNVAEQNSLISLRQIPVLNGGIVCDVCRILDILLSKNWSLAFQGDSMTRQSFAALECEFHRRGFHVISNWTSTIHPGGKKQRWRYGMDGIGTLHVSKHAHYDTEVAVLRYYAMYRPNENMKDVSHIAKRNDILVFDHGLHYQKREIPILERETLPILKTTMLSEKSNLKLVAWRETTAQFYKGTGGHYDYSVEGDRCKPMKGNATETGYHLKTIKSLADSLRVKLQILPFREYTSQFHTLVDRKGDCSHPCSTPSYWLYLWRNLRNAIDSSLLQLE